MHSEFFPFIIVYFEIWMLYYTEGGVETSERMGPYPGNDFWLSSKGP
jgi:hypothetical protein